MSTKTKAFFMEVETFKGYLGVDSLDIFTNDDSSKRAIKAGSIWISVQKDIDYDQPMVFITDKLLPDGKPNWLSARLINFKEGKRLFTNLEKTI